MQIKKIIVYSIVIFALQKYPYSYAGSIVSLPLSDEAAQQFATIAGKAAKTIESSSSNLNDAAKVLAQGHEKAAALLAAGNEKAAKELGSDAAGKIASVGAYGITAGAVLIVFTSVGQGLVGIKSTFWPSQEEQLRAAQANKEVEYLKREKEFKKCLLDHAKTSEKTSSGRPAACEDVATMFAIAGGSSEVDHLTKIFKDRHKK